jgi:type 1 glutamine amidotransferase
MRKILNSILWIATCTFFSIQSVYPADEPLVRVLIVTGQHDHDWQATTPMLSQMLQQNSRFSVSVLNDPNQIDDSLLKYFDVIVLNWSNWPSAVGSRWNMTTENAIINFVKNGKGIAFFHADCMAHQTWPEYAKMTGVVWETGKSGTSDVHSFKVVIKDKQHPVTQDMQDFWIKDELMHKMRLQSTTQVLCSANSAKNQKGSGKDEPVIICSTYGSGRCFDNLLGHDTTAMQNVAWKTMMLRGIEWAATGMVTIPIPMNWPGWQQDSESAQK